MSGIDVGAWRRANGSRVIVAAVIAPVASTGPGVPDTLRWPITFPLAYASDESTTARVPAMAHQPPSGWPPASTPTPTRPSPKPSSWPRESGSWGRKRRPRTIVKSGTVDCAMAAIPESMCFSPHATSQNGTAFAIAPITSHWRHEARSSRSARVQPNDRTTYASSTAAAMPARAHIIGAGSIPPSTATLMKRYEAPQTDARSRSSGQ